MAARRRRGRHKMTPRRRAALKKAQAASARKRRFSGLKSAARTAGAVGATIAAGAIMYHVESAARDPRRIGTAVSFVKGKFSKGPKTMGERQRPLKYYGRPNVPVRGGVAGRRAPRLQPRPRHQQGRLF